MTPPTAEPSPGAARPPLPLAGEGPGVRVPAWPARYIGAPWQSGGNGPESYDCWGLVRAVYRDIAGIELPLVDVDAHDPRAVLAAFHQAAGAPPAKVTPGRAPIHPPASAAALGLKPSDWHWQGAGQCACGALQALDVLLLSSNRRPRHAAVAAGGGPEPRVLHTIEGAGAVLQTPAQLSLHGWRVLAIYRHRQLIEATP